MKYTIIFIKFHFLIKIILLFNHIILTLRILISLILTYNHSGMQEYSSKTRDNTSSYDQILSNAKRSYNFQNMQRSIQISQTDKRIQQIKRKYDTPNRKQRLSQLSAKKSDFTNKQNQNIETNNFKTKSFVYSGYNNQQSNLNQSKAGMISNSKLKNSNFDPAVNYKYQRLTKNSGVYDYRGINSIYKNESEQQFFKKVKQMKQSLLCGQNSVKGVDLKGSNLIQSRDSRTASNAYDTNHNVEKDRIDNIDKINQKIKGILQCLNVNQRTRLPSKYSQIQNQNKAQNLYKLQTQSIASKQVPKTPVRSIMKSSNLGRQSFGMNRHERSQILEKIQVNRNSKVQELKKQTNNQQEKWEKLSNKLEKYQFQNKLRIQKALETSNQMQSQIPPVQKQQRNNRSFYQPTKICQRPSELVRRDNKSVDFKDFRSKNFLPPSLQTDTKERDRSVNFKDLKNNKQYEMRSGKKLDDEIDRIQKKIQQFQQQKKSLNINFKPFIYSNTKSTSNLAIPNLRFDHMDRNISEFTRSLYKNEINYQNKDKNSQNQVNNSQKINNYQNSQIKIQSESTFRERKDSYREKEQLSFGNQQIQHKLNSKIQIKLQKSDPSSVRTSKFVSQNSSRFSDDRDQQQSYAVQHETKEEIQLKSQEQSYSYFYEDSLKKSTDQGIQQRKKKLMNEQNRGFKKIQLKNLVEKLCQQVKLDQDFRNSKIWYEYNSNPNKDHQIQKLLPQKSIQEIKELMKVRQSENNPFFTAQGYESSFEKVIQLYKYSQNHWKKSIYRKFNKNSLQNQGFTNKDLDLQKKGHVNLGDLVRFLNLESGTFYRNRDLSLIFIRVCKQNQSTSFTELPYDWLIQTFSE